MATTGKHINTHHLTTVNMKEVRQLLPSNHCIREFDETVPQGVQEVGDYFVSTLDRFHGKKKLGKSCMVRLRLIPVLQDGTRDNRSVDCFLYGPYCKALEEMLSTNLEFQGTWSANRAREDKVVWIVLHRAFVVPCTMLKKKFHPLSFVVGPQTGPDCQMWLLLGRSSTEPGTSRDSSPSSLLIDDVSLPASPLLLSPSPSLSLSSPVAPPSPPLTTVIASNVQSSSSSTLSKRSTSSTQASLTHSSFSNTNTRPKPCTTAQSSGRTCAPPSSVHGKKRQSRYTLQPLSAGVTDCKFSTAGVVVELVKMRALTKNGKTIYDILKVADKTCTEPAASQTHFMVKVFHNDGIDWPEDGMPAIGQVLVFKDMMCKKYRGCMEGIVYTTKMVCICTQDENKQLMWHSHSKECPDNIEHAEKMALELFDWWAKDGSTFKFGEHNIQLSSRPAAVLPTCNISQVGGKGRFTLYCKVVNKTLYPSPVRPRVVLRVCDGTCTSFQFEEITYDPSVEVDESQLVFGIVGSREVDIMVKCSSIPPELENLQVPSYVRLRGLDCVLLPGGCRRLIFILDDDDEHVKVLEEDDPEIQLLKNREQQAEESREEAAMEFIMDEVCSTISEEIEGGVGLTAQDSLVPCSVTPSPQPDLPTDSFEIFVRQNELPKKLPPDRDSPASKRRRLNFSSSGMNIQALFPFRPTPTLQPSSPKRSPHPSHNHMPQNLSHLHNLLGRPSILPLHNPPPLGSLSIPPPLIHLSPSSPHPSTAKITPTRQPQQHTPPQVPSHTSSSVSAHDSALEEVQQAGSADTSGHGALQTTTHLKFHTEVVGEAKQSSLETFYFQGKVGEVHCVQAAITDIRVIATGNCWCKDADQACLHQWVWGLCDKCDNVFPSAHLAKVYSPLALNSLDFLLCRSCMHEHATHSNAQPVEGDGEEQAQGTAPQFLGAVVKPFIKIKVEVENPTSRFQLTPWLTADDATLFFGIKPNFKWIVGEEEELQKRIGVLLEHNSTLTLAMMKKQVKGRIDLHIVNTVLHYSYPHSETLLPKTPNPQHVGPIHPLPATSTLPQPLCPEPSLTSSLNPQSPTTLLDTPNPTSPADPLPPTSSADLLPPTSPSDPLPPTSPSDPLPPTSPSDPLPPISPSDPVPPTSPPHT
ncbi:uncharacterized protein LOC123511406 isoform X2 [Portunus trituberculatus]|uniref:uncharacterized protein LOC123511406 isoform X2 n=1 Tax=Portunus trituberculatus TaxID=210409 RepID=UPI001E1CCC19|nr:uncharacterized protein LOC123511406 isoform X2 [Portunus trituberculatus]